MKPSKAFSVFLSSTLLLCGCYSQSTVTRGEVVPVNEPAVFYLKDGSYVEAKAYEHMRSATGYQVTGVRYTKIEGVSSYQGGPFSGVIADSEIQKVTASKLNVVTTVLTFALAAGLVALGYFLVEFPGLRWS